MDWWPARESSASASHSSRRCSTHCSCRWLPPWVSSPSASSSDRTAVRTAQRARRGHDRPGRRVPRMAAPMAARGRVTCSTPGGHRRRGLRRFGRTALTAGAVIAVTALHRNGTEMMAVPIWFPDDPSIGEPEIPAVDRTANFASESQFLLRDRGGQRLALPPRARLPGAGPPRLVRGVRRRGPAHRWQLRGARRARAGRSGGPARLIPGGAEDEGQRRVRRYEPPRTMRSNSSTMTDPMIEPRMPPNCTAPSSRSAPKMM